MLVGYSTESKAYRLWDYGTKTVINEKDVRFIEEQNIVANEKEQQTQLCPIQLREESEEDSPEQEEELKINKEETDQEEDESPNREEVDRKTSMRGRGCPRLERTGRPGRPRKIYQYRPCSSTEGRDDPMHVQEALNRSDGEQ